jgi:acyl-CoA reductase-like NAD-dependent aldehyde dehydrogenase
MCTAPQNIFIPKSGIKFGDQLISIEQFAEKLSEAISALVDNPKAGPFVLGTIQNPNTFDRVKDVQSLDARIWLESRSIENPMFKNARIATPVVLQVNADQKEIYSKELFGPIVLLIKTEGVEESIELAKELAETNGAISCAAYSLDSEIKEKIADQMSLAYTPVSFNLTGSVYVNQNAGFSDFHVTGGNPSGNASFTNPEFLVKRFTWVGMREVVS